MVNSSPSCEFGELTLNDFAITDSEEAAFDKLWTLCGKHDIQCAVLSKNQKANLVLPTLKKSLAIQELERETEASNIVYLRVFKDYADNADTIRKVLDFLSEMFKVSKDLKYLVVVGDGKTYEYLRKLKYQYRPAMNWLIPFPGDWHICKNYQKVLMKIYWHAGLKNMAERAGMKTKILNSLEKCGNFQRTHNFLIQSFHAILRCQIDAFFENLSADAYTCHLDFLEILSSKIEKICEENSPGEQKSSSEQIEAFNEIQKFMSDSSDCDNLHKDFNSFCNSMAEQDDTWHFWREFVAKSMLPYLGLYLSIRSEQWDLRLASLKMMAPIFHAFDSSNYINIIPNHIAEMLCLPPSLLEHFKNGGFVASIKGNTWSSVALDESHEMCINKDVKAAISKLSDDYISKIVSYLPYRAKSLKNFRSQLEVFSGKESSKSIKFSSKDDELMEYNVKKLINAIKHYDLLPSKVSKNRGLFNVFTKTSADLQQNFDMLNFRATGETEMNAFIKARVIGTPSTDAPVRRKNLKVFKGAKKERKNQNSKSSEKDKKTLLACLRKTIANCKQNGTQVPDFLQFNELPRALCTSDGLPNKGQKSNVLKFYQRRYNTVITCIYPPLWKPDTIILEGMFLINSSPLYGQHKTFVDYVIFLVKRWIVPHLSKPSVKEVHVLFDHPERQGNYPKQVERLRRDVSSLLDDNQSSGNNFWEINDLCHLPSDWRSFLADRKSKRSLVNYLSASFLTLVPKFINDGQSFTTAGGFDGEKKDKAFTCTKLETFENISLKSNHEEADSRVWFHALTCTGRNILIFSPDTDTVHVGLPFVDEYEYCHKNVVIQLSDRLGHQSFIYANKLVECFRNDPDLAQINSGSICSIIQFLFAVSGCDYISFFAGFGKIKFYQMFFQYASFISAGSSPPGILNNTANGFLAFLRLVGCLYYKKYASAFSDKSPSNFFKSFSGDNILDIHIQWLQKIRERVWQQCNDEEKDYLPSVESLRFHWLRACWVCDVWLQADESNVSHLPLDDYGWTIDNGLVKFKWDTPENIARVVDVVKQLTSGCGCKKGCKTKRCKCHQAHQVCNISCKCKSCENPHQNGKCSDSLCTANMTQFTNNQLPVLNTVENTPQFTNNQLPVLNTVENTPGLTLVTDIDVFEEIVDESDNSDNDSGSETELDCFPSDDEYDFDNLNQLLRKATDIESDEEDEEHDINDIDKVNDAFFE